MKIHFIEKLKNRKFKLQKATRKISLALASITLVGALTGCGAKQNTEVPVTNDNINPTYNSTLDQGAQAEESQEGVATPNAEESLEAQIAALQQRLDELENANPYSAVAANDTYTQDKWDEFVTEAKKVLAGKINNENQEGIEAALLLFNIDYLDDNAKQVLLTHYEQGQDVEAELNKLYAVLSQVREYNTEIDSADNYLSYADVMLDEQDKAIISVLDGYAKEVITLRSDLTEANVNRIKEIFDIIYKFSNGTGTIKVTINGAEQDIAQIHLSHGGIFAAENIAQDISVLSRNIVSQEDREKLDSELRSKDTLAKNQEKINIYTAMASVNAKGVNAEAQEKVVNQYNYQLGVIAKELEVMGVTAEEAQALFTVTNIDYFMDSTNSQHAFDVIYENGFDINAAFTNAEEAVRKIQAYDDTQEQVYDMARLVIASEADAISLRAFTQTAHGVTSSDATVVANAAHIVKGYTQFSSEATVDYQTKDANGDVVNHSIDKNGLGKGAYQVVNWYTYYSVSNHKSAYGTIADSLIQLVDGSQVGLNPYEQIVLEVEDYCAENNIVVYNYEVGNTK